MATGDIFTTDVHEVRGDEPPTDECPDCDGKLVTDAGETRREQCGLAVEAARLDRRGKRTFEGDQYPFCGRGPTGRPDLTGD